MKILMVGLLAMLSSLAGANCEVKLPEGWQTSSVEVPFNWSQKNSEKIKVAYYYKDQSLYAGKTPIIFFNGGPTVDGHLAIGLVGELLKDQNIIFMDQRGTGCSTPFKKWDGNADEYRFYASDSIVQDAEKIRITLFGERKWKIFGQSYGGLISFRYLEKFPHSIESAHIHGFGFSPDGKLLDKREQRISEITPAILNYKNLGQLIEQLRGNENFQKTCLVTPYSLKKEFCGPDAITGLFMVTGFKDRWRIVHSNFAKFLKLINEGKKEELATSFEKFARTYLLRFGSVEHTAALHSITYYEMIPGKFFYNGCSGNIENDLISECRFGKNFLIRTNGHPTFAPAPHDLEVIRENISSNKIPVYYYAGLFDTFLPVETLSWTANALGINENFVLFPDSGHEGFYSEKLVLENLIR